MQKPLRLLIATALYFDLAWAQEPQVSFNGPRSLADALRVVQRAVRTPISFEEGAYENASDLTRTTPISHPRLRPMLIARTSETPVVVPLPGLGPNSDVLTLVDSILNAYHKAGLPGQYKATRKQTGVEVSPVSIAGPTGAAKQVVPAMTRAISFAYAERSVLDTFKLIAEGISKASGHDVKLAMAPFYQESPLIALSAAGLSGSDALKQLAAKLGIPAISYQLGFDPSDGSYYLAIETVLAPVPASSEPGQTPLNPSTENPFFVKTQP